MHDIKLDEHQHLTKKIRQDLRLSKIIAVSGPIGAGKTSFLKQLKQNIKQENETLVCKSLAIEKSKVKLSTLITALLYDLSQEETVKIPSNLEQSKKKLKKLMVQLNKPVVLFVDDAHDINKKTFIDLQVFIESLKDEGYVLSAVLAGQSDLLEKISDKSISYTLN
jgi:type II secretory pathway predicted ATPase ExeA